MKKTIIVLVGMLVFLLSSCSGGDEVVFVDPVEGDFIETGARYDNKFDETQIPNQWEGYGIGDPYVLRHNGVYYLYASTKNYETGVRTWKSVDLLNWELVNNGISETGYSSEDPSTLSAYAPEVIYWDGTFYMYTSPGGSGHHVLTSDSPEGPFIKATDNVGESIDGSVFIDNNEQMYFLRAHNTGTRMIEMINPLTMGTGKTLDNTSIGSWTEGPSIINRNGIYYMTYTGTHVTSPGYRVNYSTATELGQRDSFTMGVDNSLLLSTEDDFNGLGHNSTVLGPNMDSYYIVYHNLNSSAGPNRSFNINRLLFNGKSMYVNGASLTDNIAPLMPDFTSTDGVENYTNGLSNTSANKKATIEFNFIGSTPKLKFGYENESNYSYVSISNNVIELHGVNGGTDETIATGVLINTFDFTKLHQIRVISSGSKVSVLFDNLTKIESVDLSISEGKVGYESVTEMKYSAFSNQAFGSSDNVVPKREFVPANTYLEENNTTLSENPNGSHDILIQEDGYASYVVDIGETTLYAMYMNLVTESAGEYLSVQIDQGTPMIIEIPELNGSGDYENIMVTEFEIPKGVHKITIKALDTELSYNSFSLNKSSYSTPLFSDTLEQYLARGAEYVTLWKIKDEGHHAIAGNRQLVYFGDSTIRDCNISITMNFVGETASSTAGILVRGSDVGLSSHESFDSLVGYYIGFNNNRAFINRYNYNLSEYNVAINTNFRPESGTEFEVNVEIIGNQINVYVDGELILEYYDTDVIETGRIGLYTEGAEVIYSDLVITE